MDGTSITDLLFQNNLALTQAAGGFAPSQRLNAYSCAAL
jgi:hypothetical protein